MPMMPAAEQVAITREYLAEISATDVGLLPPSRLLAECAESRVQLGRLIEVIEEHTLADADQMEVIFMALGDAEDFRRGGGRPDMADAYRRVRESLRETRTGGAQ